LEHSRAFPADYPYSWDYHWCLLRTCVPAPSTQRFAGLPSIWPDLLTKLQ
jgi:hypothetical protein